LREKILYLLLKFAAYIAPILLSGQAIADSGNLLPPGWRVPTKFELNDGWRSKDLDRFALVKGDFNGDGQPDEAMLLIAEHRQRFGLFVFLSQANGSPKMYQLDTSNDLNFLADMGIAKVEPGKYMTACGKGYWRCKKNELPEILLLRQAINYFKTESASSYFYWDEHKKRFRKTWISD
jgi:hypothetical protein